MTNLNLLPCPMCGSPAEIDSTGAAECYGWDWQTITIECTDAAGKHCGMSIEMQADYYYAPGAWRNLTNLWNSFPQHGVVPSADTTDGYFSTAELQQLSDRWVGEQVGNPIPCLSPLPTRPGQKFGLSGDPDGAISLYCDTLEVTADGVKFYVINGAWTGTLYPDSTFVCHSPFGETLHTVTNQFLEPVPNLRRENYDEAIAWMNGKLDGDITEYLYKERSLSYFADMDDDIAF